MSKLRFSRRDFLKAGSVLGAGAALSHLPASMLRALQSTEMRLWWWADEPAFSAWIDDTVSRFQAANSGVSINSLQMDVSAVITQFVTAAAAGEPPDIQFLWNGLYHMENVWLGYLEALNDYLPADVLEQSNALALSVYDGKQYRVGWYPVPLFLEYNKDVWDKAGLDADNPPSTWDDWMSACDKLKTSGVTPFGGGGSDGYWGEWYFSLALPQNLDSAGQAIELFIGDRDFSEPRYYELWSRLEEMVKAEYLNDDILSVDLFSALSKVVTGEIATTINVGPVIPSHIAELGDRIGLMTMPSYGTGPLAGKPVLDTQGFGIPSGSLNKELAAQFLLETQSQASLDAMWELTRYFPANKTWDSAAIDDPVLKELHSKWVVGDTALWISTLMPTLFWTDAMFVVSQEILAGNMTGEEAGAQNASIAQQWRSLNPDLIENYQIYAAGIAEITGAE
jgi:raffinose/stachyose/melibiose transport system substrate-binding protein